MTQEKLPHRKELCLQSERKPPFWGLPFLFTPPINGSILKNLGNQERYNIADRLVYHVNNKRMFP